MSAVALHLGTVVAFLLMLLFLHVSYRAGERSATTTAAAAAGTSTSLLAAMDRRASPCHDFYTYACGGWLEWRRASFPPDRAYYSRAFSALAESIEDETLRVLDDQWPLLDHFFSACMDERRADALGRRPIERLLDNTASPSPLTERVALLHALGIDVFFSFGSAPDLVDPSMTYGSLEPGGLALDSYSHASSLDAYTRFLGALERLDGGGGFAVETLLVERTLDAARLTPAQRRVPVHRPLLSADAIAAVLAPAFDWHAYTRALGLSTANASWTSVPEPRFIDTLARLLRETPAPALDAYMRAHILAHYAPALSADYRRAHFDFVSALTGVHTPSPRNRTCARLASSTLLGELIGHVYVTRRGDSAARQRAAATAVVERVKTAFVDELRWLDAPTHARALDKLRRVTNRIGYPRYWRAFELYAAPNASSFVDVLNELALLASADDLARIGRPTNRERWSLWPQTVNAYYQPSDNSMNFPAAMLSEPFLSDDDDVPRLYGAFGAIVGHELSHAFDDTGRLFNGSGSLDDWWTAAASTLFDARANAVRARFAAYRLDCPSAYCLANATTTLSIDANLTLGENLADATGVRVAYAAMRTAVEAAPPPPVGQQPLSADERFFVAYAQNWCEVGTVQAYERQLAADPHSPGKFRVLGALADNDDFRRTFCETAV